MITKFQNKVYSLLKKVPKGKVTTYREIGKRLGKGQVYRAVGAALKKNPFAPKIPCHRVVKADGSLGGYQGKNVKKKIKLLRKEGIFVKNNRIKDFEKKLFKF